MTEAQLLSDILRAIGARPDVRVWRVNTMGALDSRTGRFVRSVQAGHPDIAGVIRGGRALYVEVKSPKGRLTSEQESWRAMLEALGALYVLARSVDDVVRALDGAA